MGLRKNYRFESFQMMMKTIHNHWLISGRRSQEISGWTVEWAIFDVHQVLYVFDYFIPTALIYFFDILKEQKLTSEMQKNIQEE